MYIVGLGERCKLPLRDLGQSPERKCILDVLRAQKTRLQWPQMSFSSRFSIIKFGRGNDSQYKEWQMFLPLIR